MKKTVLVLCILVCAVFAASSLEIRVGAGLSYRPLSNDLLDTTYFADRESWCFTLHSQANLKRIGAIVDITPDYVSKEAFHLTADVGLNTLFNFKKTQLNLGVAIPFTIYNGQVGIDDIAFGNIPALKEAGRIKQLFWGTKIFGGLDYKVSERVSIGTRYSVAFGKFMSTELLLSDFFKNGLEKGQLDFFATFKVL